MEQQENHASIWIPTAKDPVNATLAPEWSVTSQQGVSKVENAGKLNLKQDWNYSW